MNHAADESGRVIRFELAAPTMLLNQTLRMHWRVAVKHKRALAWEVKLAMGRHIPPSPFARAHVRIERHSIGQPDYDGLVGGLKWLIDCLLPRSTAHPTGLAIIADDNPDAMTLEAISIKAKRRTDQKTIVIIREITNDDNPAGIPPKQIPIKRSLDPD